MRTTDTSVALLGTRGRFLVAEPFFERGPRVVVERHRDSKPGRLALVSHGKRGKAKVVRMLGKPDVARDVIEALMLSRGLRRSFPPGVERAAQEAVEAVEDSSRRDLRDLYTFTIDPVTAKDFDDAISAEQLEDGAWRVWVHVADVSAYVKPGSPVDREAYRRATSVYVPGAVEPMLPEVLSNHACSLVPDQERFAVTAELELRGAEVRRAAFYRSLIRSDRRYSYEEVDELFAGGADLGAPLTAARAAAAALQARREDEGALAVEQVEPEFAFDRRGHVVSSEATEQTESHRLIEHLMIAANSQVARVLSDRGVPALYRVHENPDAVAVERLLDQLASLDVATPPAPGRMSSTQTAEVVAQASRLVDQHVRRTGGGRRGLTFLILRSLKQAHYSPLNRGHAGLSLTHYCHFTSPIRRYPDLICHRALLSAVGGDESAPRGSTLEEAGAWTSARERDAMTIERDADDVARCFLLERELFESGFEQEFDGEVTSVIGAGAFVAFGDSQEGMLPVRRMRGDWWELNEQGTILEGTRSGQTLRIGDRVRVVVRQIDAPRGRVDLDLVTPPDR